MLEDQVVLDMSSLRVIKWECSNLIQNMELR